MDCTTMELAVTDWKIRVIWVITVYQWGYRSQKYDDHSPFIFRVNQFPLRLLDPENEGIN